MIDTHSHIYEPEFAADREEVIQRAKQVGVEQILLPNINAESIGSMLSLCRLHPECCFPMIGLHPTDVEPANYKQTLSDMEKLLEEPEHPFIAIGEVGLDYYWDKSNAKEQEAAFRTQIGGTAEEAHELLDFPGFVLGIGGVVTYKKSTLPEVLATVPLERIVLETDSPYLAPVPYRGKRNESAYIVEVLRKIASIYNVEEKQAEFITNDNAKRIFRRMNTQISNENNKKCT